MNENLDPQNLLKLNRLVHEPARLLILTILAGAKRVEFTFLENVSNLSKGNLSSHMSKLEAAGLISVHKRFRGKRPLTELSITRAGRKALDDYRNQLAAVMEALPHSQSTSKGRKQ